jgi:hypothetical protein
LAVAAALKVTTELPLPGAATLVLENVAVTPAGNPLALKLTAELKPFSAAVVSVTCAVAPRFTVVEVELFATEKLGGAWTVTVTGTLRVSPPPVATRLTE